VSNFDDFVSWLPPSFLGADAVTMRAFLQALGRQCDDLATATQDNQNQIFIQLATWSLSTYEQEFGIKLVDGGTDDQRRNNIMAKDRSGQGATPAALQNILAAYGYDTSLVEDFANYQFTVKFTDFRGVPSNIGDLKLLMGQFVSAHLNVLWQYLYLLWSELEGSKMNFTTLATYTWDALQSASL